MHFPVFRSGRPNAPSHPEHHAPVGQQPEVMQQPSGVIDHLGGGPALCRQFILGQLSGHKDV